MITTATIIMSTAITTNTENLSLTAPSSLVSGNISNPF